MPTFDQVYNLLQLKNPASITSSRKTHYSVVARLTNNGEKAIIATTDRNSTVYVYSDYWGEPKNRSGTRQGGIFNGDPSIYDWYNKEILQ
jgi:hypothetical protein